MNNPNTITDRIRYLIEHSRLSQANFARRLGMDPANLSKHLSGKLPITSGLINRIVADMAVSKTWLADGSGLPFDRPEHHTTLSKQPPLSSQSHPVPVYDLDVTAGCVELSRLLTEDRIVGSIALPNLPRDCAVVRVSGDSMCPVIHNGGYVAIRRIANTDCIFWGQIYVILLEDYRMVKYLRRHPSDPTLVVLRSANPDYDDMEVPRKEILGLYVVESVINYDVRC